MKKITERYKKSAELKKLEFVNPAQAKKIKDLGFDEPCMGYFTEKHDEVFISLDYVKNSECVPGDFSAPLKQQVLRFFREKYGMKPQMDTYYDEWGFYIPASEYNEIPIRESSDSWNYEEAEESCINKLIKLVKEKSL